MAEFEQQSKLQFSETEEQEKQSSRNSPIPQNEEEQFIPNDGENFQTNKSAHDHVSNNKRDMDEEILFKKAVQEANQKVVDELKTKILISNKKVNQEFIKGNDEAASKALERTCDLSLRLNSANKSVANGSLANEGYIDFKAIERKALSRDRSSSKSMRSEKKNVSIPQHETPKSKKRITLTPNICNPSTTNNKKLPPTTPGYPPKKTLEDVSTQDHSDDKQHKLAKLNQQKSSLSISSEFVDLHEQEKIKFANLVPICDVIQENLHMADIIETEIFTHTKDHVLFERPDIQYWVNHIISEKCRKLRCNRDMLINTSREAHLYGYNFANMIRDISELTKVKAQIWTASFISTISNMKKSQMLELQLMVSNRDQKSMDELLVSIDKMSAMRNLARDNKELKEKMSKLKSY